MKIFKEEQRFNQPWLIILILMSLLVPIGIIIKTYIEDPNSFSTSELLSIIGAIILASSILFLFKLSTRIDEEGIHYQFFPFHWSYKTIKWNAIDNAYVRTYSPLSEYGGWGIRGTAIWNTSSKGKALNVSGDVGIQITLKTGKNLLIGTQHEENAKNTIATYKLKFKQ
ncbi:hypothetical protein [Winogradskyella pacifica]|uniref:hypothetical protein n=1 Tax=Winogradskyella pacifica TaxID=664642 RepID=UPI0015CD5631|nr:hypothetical protein [Winogradskyella pacifica]